MLSTLATIFFTVMMVAGIILALVEALRPEDKR